MVYIQQSNDGHHDDDDVSSTNDVSKKMMMKRPILHEVSIVHTIALFSFACEELGHLALIGSVWSGAQERF